jgi:hypothetical protein
MDVHKMNFALPETTINNNLAPPKKRAQYYKLN